MNTNLLSPIQNADENPRLEFRDGQAMLRMTSTAGTNIERLVSMAAVREAALGIPVDSGWIDPEIVRWGDGRRGEWAVMFVPARLHNLELTTGAPPDEVVERINAPLPAFAFMGIACKYFVWALKTEEFRPYNEIYRAPLPNVYGANVEAGSEVHLAGEICWGYLRPPNASPRNMKRAWDLFIGSTFNNHAANGKSKTHPEDVRDLLKELAGETASYPVDDLMRFDQGITLDQMVRLIFSAGGMIE